MTDLNRDHVSRISSEVVFKPDMREMFHDAVTTSKAANSEQRGVQRGDLQSSSFKAVLCCSGVGAGSCKASLIERLIYRA